MSTCTQILLSKTAQYPPIHHHKTQLNFANHKNNIKGLEIFEMLELLQVSQSKQVVVKIIIKAIHNFIIRTNLTVKHKCKHTWEMKNYIRNSLKYFEIRYITTLRNVWG